MKKSVNTKSETKTKKTFCAVCPEWEIKNPARCSNTLKKAAKTVYFCTSRCKERYVKAPEKFA